MGYPSIIISNVLPASSVRVNFIYHASAFFKKEVIMNMLTSDDARLSRYKTPTYFASGAALPVFNSLEKCRELKTGLNALVIKMNIQDKTV